LEDYYYDFRDFGYCSFYFWILVIIWIIYIDEEGQLGLLVDGNKYGKGEI
jgi:hypothetical protein